jgi:hypothetical protein
MSASRALGESFEADPVEAGSGRQGGPEAQRGLRGVPRIENVAAM